ncbi:sigma-70 family RNA polymerase sigma factor [Nocardioides sp. CGMCC 1.13656]|uniref:sigma-70 family RNA polymerase sigma factor n=1 Tax=Nocardioides TaxID=1839 RepID=UPI0012FCB190|nr:sigma-70 family RNA polymerase sigma factor [Nocardioides sp. CGMCC 1.13656]MBA2956657.1 sigma-70 family RNA polymerase sigma factor [Nocardioides sp. CGMCC 1.13656]
MSTTVAFRSLARWNLVASFVPAVDERGDAELITAVRAGDVGAYGELFSRHVGAARRLARQLVSAGDVDDLVSEAFAKVLGVLQRGGGPDLAFRAYLLTAVRRLHVDRIRSTARLHSTDDLTPFDPGVPFRDTALEGFENATAAKAFASLPERWQLVLWHTEVEGQKPADIAPILAMSANAVSALAYRAREGLRQAYLSMHASDVDDDACARTRAELGAYVRGGLSRRDATRVEQHLRECRRCTAIYLELTEVNSGLRLLLAPLLLGTVATAYLAATGTAAGTTVGGVAQLLGRARDAVVSHAPAAAVAGAAASAVVAGTVISLHQKQPTPAPEAEEAPTVTITPSAAPDAGRRAHVARHRALDPRDLSTTAAAAATPPTGFPSVGAEGTTPGSPGSPGPSGSPASPQPAGSPASGASADGPGTATAPAPSVAPAPTQPAAPSGSPAPTPSSPSTPDQPSSPTAPALVDATVSVSAGPAGIDVGLGLGVAGVPVLPETHVGVPLPGSG